MKVMRHGLSVGIERVDSEFFLSIKAVGKLTHEDYKTITPMLESALKGVSDPSIKLFFDASELDGWELRAAWDDFKLGLAHNKEFTRVAVLGHKKWLELSSKIGSWFMAGEYHYFEDYNQAMEWLFDKQSS